MDDDAFDTELRSLLLEHLQRLASELGDLAVLRSVEDQEHGGEFWLLQPSELDAAAIRWDVTHSDASSTYLGLGRATWVEVFTDPRRESPAEAAGSTIEIVDAVVAGRFREEAWYSKRTGQLVSSVGRIRYSREDRWRRIGSDNPPLPLLRRRHLFIAYPYAPYRPS